MPSYNIKIDYKGDFEIMSEKYNGYGYEEHNITFTFEEIEEAYLLAKSKKYPESVRYGCIAKRNRVSNTCDFDCDKAFYLDVGCELAIDLRKNGKTKADCEYWRVAG